MTAIQTARQRARAELTSEIKAEARRQVAEAGAQRLSLRAVARELGMASSALYRYFPSRDELLTALIIDAYDALGESAERAAGAVARGDARGQWRACCTAVRDWALAHPHEYALIYGTPVPGYQAPQETIGPAGRVAAVLGGLLAGAFAARSAGPASSTGSTGPGGAAARLGGLGQLTGRAGGQASDVGDHGSGSPPAAGVPLAAPLPPVLREQAAMVAAAIAPGVPGPVIARALIAFTQLFGMVSFELFGQLVGSADPAEAFFSYAVDQMADFVGL